MASTRLSMTADGRLAVTKRATAGPGADRLRYEADILGRAGHPGVVELLAVADLDGGAELHTAFVGGGTLAQHLGTIEAAKGAKVAAALATTLADLHGRGIAHQRVTADHVLVTGADGIRLCGFAGATAKAEARACAAEDAAADVEAVATLVRETADQATGAGRAALHAVADRVLRAEPSARPSMRSLAHALDALTTGGHPPTTPVTPGPRILAARSPVASRGRRLPRLPSGRTAMAVAVVAAVCVVAGAVLVTAPGRDPSPPPAAAPAPAPPDARPSTTTTAPLVTREGPSVAPPGPTARPALAVADGVVSLSGRRWRVASADDLVVVGDWDCDGLATPAVIRPGTGHVWTYARWAQGSEGVVADAAGSVPGATSATAVTVDACDHLDVTDTAGRTTRLDLSP